MLLCASAPRPPMKPTTPSAHLPTGLIRRVALLALLLLPACGRAKPQKPTVRKTQAADIVWCQIRGEEIRVPNKDAEEWAIRRATFLHQTRELGSRRCFIRAYSVRQAEMKFSKGSQIPDPPSPPIVTDLVIPESMLSEWQAAGRNVADVSECRATKKGIKDKHTGESGLTLYSIGEIRWQSPTEAEVSADAWSGPQSAPSCTYTLRKVNGVWQVAGEHK